MPRAKAATPASGQPTAAGTPGVVGGAPPPRLGTNDPDLLIPGGLADKFNGRVVSLAAGPRLYKSGRKKGTYSGFNRMLIQADDDTLGQNGVVTEFYGATGLNQWVPSRRAPEWNAATQQYVYYPAGPANATPEQMMQFYMALHMGQVGWPAPQGTKDVLQGNLVGGQPVLVTAPDDYWGTMWVPGPQNSKENLPLGTKWAQFLEELKKVNYYARAPHVPRYDYSQFLVGVYGKWVRLPFEFRGGPPDDAGSEEGGQQRRLETLCLVEILDLGPISGGGASPMVTVPATVPTAAPATAAQVAPAPVPVAAPVPAANNGGVEAATNAVITQLVAGKPAGVSKAEVGTALYAQISGMGLPGEQALLLVNNAAWVIGDDRTFGYDESTGVFLPLS